MGDMERAAFKRAELQRAREAGIRSYAATVPDCDLIAEHAVTAVLDALAAKVEGLPWNPVDLPDDDPEWAVNEYRAAVLALIAEARR